MTARISGVVPGRAEAAARACAAALRAEPAVLHAPRVALYAALPDELPSRPSFDALSGCGPQRLLPRSEGRELVFAAVERWEALAPGRYGVPEPAGPGVALAPGDVVLVPGRAFDRSGARLGRGGGYYDRLLERGPGLVAIGMGYGFQIVDRVPCDSRDQRLDAIVSEAGLHWLRRAE